MNDGDRLDEILEGGNLEAGYDEWASTYDADHDEWGWRGPEAAVESMDWHGGEIVLDAGCGTGRVGRLIQAAGRCNIQGLDLSAEMLAQAKATDAYTGLIRGSLFDLPYAAKSFDVVISTGVFTHAHVGAEAFPELIRVAREGALVALSVRDDIAETLLLGAETFVRSGAWRLEGISATERFHPDRDDVTQSIYRWRIV